VLGSPAVAGPEVRRLAGTDRYSTAVAVSQAGFPAGAPAVVVTTGADFPDALAGGPAAARLRGPVLLTGRDGVPPVVLAELTRLAPSRVLLLGGTGAVSSAVQDQLTAAGLPVQRLAGAGRYETAALVSGTVFPADVPVAYVATGADYPDALAAAAAAGAAGAPVLLVGRSTLPAATATELSRLRPRSLVVLGGEGAVSKTVEQKLASYAPSVRRIAGADRYATSAAVARTATGLARRLFLATGRGFADALAGGPAAAAAGAPVLLVPGSCIPAAVHVEMKRSGYPLLTLLGGSAALGSGVARLRPCTRVPDGELAPGVSLTTIADPRGPWHGKVVTVAPQAAWRLDTVLAQDLLPGLETTSSMARRTGALVAVNGDFALPGGAPVHAFAKDGRLLQTIGDPGGRTRAFAIEGRAPHLPHIGTAQQDVRLDVPATLQTAPVVSVNRGTAPGAGLTLTTVEAGPLALPPADSCALRLRRTGAPTSRDGRTVQGYLVLDDAPSGADRCSGAPLAPVGSDVLSAPVGGPDAALVTDLLAGEPVELSWSLGWPDVRDAIGGSPVLVQSGAVSEAGVGGSDPFSKRHPRTAVGHRTDGSVLLVTVSGRGADGSVGMTLRELAELFVRLGASDALNLDGGGSTTAVIDGEVQNAPSDGVERAVSSALVLSGGSAPVAAGHEAPAPGAGSSAPPALGPLSVRPSGPGPSGSSAGPAPVPLSAHQQQAAQDAQLADPGSTGGLLRR